MFGSSEQSPAAAPGPGASSPQVDQPELDENYRRFFQSTVRLERIYQHILILFYFQNMSESIIC